MSTTEEISILSGVALTVIERIKAAGFEIDKSDVINSGTIKLISNVDVVGDKLRALKLNEPTSDNSFFRLAIISYEWGALNHSIVYAERFRTDYVSRRLHLAHGKLDMADMLTQLYLLCVTLGWDFNELRVMGMQHLEERQKEFKEMGWAEIGGKDNGKK